MSQSKLLAVTLSALLISSSVASANEISTCLDVDCPIQDGTTSANCQVANQTLIVVGVSSFSVPIPGQDEDLELTWTVGGRSYEDVEPEDGDRYIERVYYLGTSPSVDLKADDLAYDGCAFYLTGPENENLFYKNSATPSFESYCRDSLKEECVSALNDKLSSLAGEQTLDSSGSDICSEIASGLQSDIPSSCSSLNDAVVRGVALTGPSAAEPLTESQNSTSNCYPTLPKSNELTRQFSYNITTTMNVTDTASAIEGETPVLSMFWSNEGEEDASIESPSIQLSCLRPVDETTASNSTMSGDGGDDESGAIPMNGAANIFGATVAAGIVVLSTWLI
ncbi:hypothetical protein FQN54_005833 [Arachnomyces sp. PD_36]|nr:hypothetical protein FQN54_005833 [Arachnomyces sp. PD_36]